MIRRLPLVLLVLMALPLAGCFAPVVDDAEPSTSMTPVPTPSPSPTFVFPAETVSGEVAFASVRTEEGVPVVGSTTGPGLLDRSRSYYVEGECAGPGAGKFELTMTSGDRAGDLIYGGTITCGTPMKDMTSEQDGYRGTVQLRFVDTDGVDLGWLRVVQE